jgi:hypothetical protein
VAHTPAHIPAHTPADIPADTPAEAARQERPVRITLIGKPGCHLCEDARAVVSRVAADLGVGWDERSIEDDPDLAEQYWEQIPVTLVDGRQHDYWRVDETRLRRALGA